MLDGLITQSDLQEQTRWYEQQLAELSLQLSKLQGESSALTTEPDSLEQCAAALDEIMAFDETNTSLYREILDKMIIHKGYSYPDGVNDMILEVRLKGIPFGMRLTLRSPKNSHGNSHDHGKNENYISDILSVEIVAIPAAGTAHEKKEGPGR